MSQEMNIPNTDLPREVLQNALRDKLNSPELTIVDVDAFRPDELEGNNFGSYVRYVTVTYVALPGDERPSTLRLFMKNMGDTPLHVTLESGSKICQRECEVFRSIHPALKEFTGLDLEAITPICYYTDERTTILENLLYDGFEMRLVRQPQDMAHVRLGITALAEYHASSYALKKQLAPTKITEKYSIMTEPFYYEGSPFGPMVKHGCQVVAERLEKFPECQKMVEFLRELQPHIFELGMKVTREEEPFNVICHGDPWSNNMMFKYVDDKPREIKLVDFQIGRYAPACVDLIYYLYSSTTHELRTKYLEAILQYYYSHFVVSIAALGFDECDFTYDQFRNHFQERILFVALVTILFVFPRYTEEEASQTVMKKEFMLTMKDFEKQLNDFMNSVH